MKEQPVQRPGVDSALGGLDTEGECVWEEGGGGGRHHPAGLALSSPLTWGHLF